MPLSAGVDVVEVQEVEESLRRFGERYLRRLFTPREIAAGAARRGPAFFATCFAVKEAALKALGVPDDGAHWRSIEVADLCSGRPELEFSGRVAEIAERQGVRRAEVSVGTTRRYAAAVVIIDRGCSKWPGVAR
jgi:holo-[acyl-carrier protein] synthase